MKNGKRGLLLLLLMSVIGLGAKAQMAVINGVIPSTVCQGGTLEVYGSNIYDVNLINCDSMIFTHTPSGTVFRLRASNPGVLPSGFVADYSGDDVLFGIDTANIVIPCSWPSGAYTVVAFDDEDCDGGNYSAPFNLTIGGPTCVGTFAYPGNSIFCMGEANPSPSSTPGTGTYVDMDSASGNAILNHSTGQLALHSGWANGVPHTIRFTAACGGTTLTTMVTLKPMSTLVMDYASQSYCKNLDSIPQPTITAGAWNGTFSVIPSAPTGFDTNDGSVTIGPSTAPGNYQVTYTPHVDACGYPASDIFSIVDLDSAIFNYDPFYCDNDANSGYPIVQSTPYGGGLFQEFGSSGLVVNGSTGQINLVSTPADTFVIAYQPNGTCAVTKYDTVIVRPPLSSSFTVPNPVLCVNSGPDTLVSAFSAGYYYSQGGFVVFTDSVQGIFDPALSSPGGPYTIFHTNGDTVCPASSQGTVTIRPQSNDSIRYASTAFCENADNPGPIFVSGLAGGTFAIQAGGIIDDTTGVVDLLASTPGTYTVSYFASPTTCPDTTYTSIKIDPAPVATFNFVPDSLCQNSGLYQINAPPSGGSTDLWYIATSADSILPGGMVNDSIMTNSLPWGGPFKIVRVSTLNTCQDSFVDYVFIRQAEDASFAYIPDEFCKADQNPLPAILGSGAGTFYNTPSTGLVVVDSSGMILLAASADSVHTVMHITGGACPDTATFQITILDAFNPYFNYDEGNRFCETFVGLLTADGITIPGGNYTFSSFPPLPGLDADSGDVMLGTAPPGTYQITMSLINTTGACEGDYTLSLVIDSVDNVTGTLSFLPGSDSVFCRNEDSAVAQIAPFTYNDGRFFSQPSNLAWLDRDRGVISLTATPRGDYDIYFVRANSCRDSILYSITVEVPEPDTLVYTDISGDTLTEFCRFAPGNALASIASLTSGVFGASSTIPQDTLFFVSNVTGEIDLTTSDAGTYDITFTDTSGCSSVTQTTVRILAGPLGTRLEFEPSDTFCQGDSIEIKATSGLFTYLVEVNGDSVGSTRTVMTTTLNNNDSVSVIITDGDGCFVRHSSAVTVYPVPDGLPIGVPGTIGAGSPISFSMGSTAPSTMFYWDVTALGSVTFDVDSDSLGPINPGVPGQITVTPDLLSDFTPGVAIFFIRPFAVMCWGDTDTVVVNINPSDMVIFVPEVFTPDNNGKNDTWLIQWRSDIVPSDYEILLYNRGGGEVYHMEGLTNQWAGDDLPDGVYFYVLRSRTSGSIVDKGGVTIRRK